MVNRLILMRAGETPWNKIGRQQGWVACPLNEIGKQQVERLAKFVRNIRLSALYSSDLERAVQTAEILGEQLGFEPIYDERLRERNVGAWQGMTLQEIRDWYPEEFNALHENPETFQVPDGDSRQQVRKRVLEAIDDILKNDDGDSIGIISHTTAIRIIVENLVPQRARESIELLNMSTTTLARNGEQWKVVRLNDVTHLEGFESHSVRELEED